MSTDKGYIHIKGARVNNLKNVEVKIPRGKLTVITGLSGSGKSSLAFDTLYAEGQRRYVESLSAYARQFLGRMQKPEVDFIHGIPPAIAIEQRVSTRNPRSTVGTSTEIYDHLKLLFARVGQTISPVSGQEVQKHQVSDVVDFAMSRPRGLRMLLLAPVVLPEGRTLRTQLEIWQNQGFTRLLSGDQTVTIAEVLEGKVGLGQSGKSVESVKSGQSVKSVKSVVDTDLTDPSLWLIVDRIVSDGEQTTANRLADSVQTAFYEGQGACRIRVLGLRSEEKRSEGSEGVRAARCAAQEWKTLENEQGTDVLSSTPLTPSLLHSSNDFDFSVRFEADGMSFIPPSVHLFDFNNPLGACPVCQGFGTIIGIDPDLVVPDKTLSVYEGAIACWHGEKMSLWNQELVMNASKFDFPVHTPYYQLTPEQQQLLWTGNRYFHGLNDFFQMLEQKQYAKIQYRVLLSRYRGRTLCTACHGSRLRPEASYVKVGGKSIDQLVNMSVGALRQWFDHLTLDPVRQLTADRLLHEIRSRLRYLSDVGLDYLTLNRLSNTLSGGESQRINLATRLGSGLVGSLYILDEPSIGLHPRDTDRLIGVLRQLRDQGNTVVVVEHDEAIMRAADCLIDIGPEAGTNGGRVVWAGSPEDIPEFPDCPDYPETPESPESPVSPAGRPNNKIVNQKIVNSFTLSYLTGQDRMPLPPFCRKPAGFIRIDGATHNNLKNINVAFPLGVMCVVTGVSGSGKSSLVRQILYPALKKHYGGTADFTGAFHSLHGDLSLLTDVQLVDQNPIGRSTRSNPATYVKAYDEIRRLMADQQLSKQMGYTAATFSFNSPGGRCEACEGEGYVTIPMQFMADVVVPCEHCHGRRFRSDVLEVSYRGRSISDILNLTVSEAVELFSQERLRVGDGTSGMRGAVEKRIVSRLQPLLEVGLGYVQLGQSSSTLSGGESQRVKLASYLNAEADRPQLFIFDEPTTGLHYHDIRTLLHALHALIQRGNSVIIIEHNTEVIRQADYVIDLGPEGGDAGGRLLFAGTPEDLLQCPESYTAKSLIN